jgi:hypothetical protein
LDEQKGKSVDFLFVFVYNRYMTIYLYVKTHAVTGLKYLGKTTRDPMNYSGSGVYWNKHLKAHGDQHTTEILRECLDDGELKEWGRYYSDLWNVTESDDWANLKPEEGDGQPAGEHHPMFGKKGELSPLYGIKREDMTGDKNPSCRPEVRESKSGDNHFLYRDQDKMKACVARMSGEGNPAKNPENVKKYAGANHTRYDHTVYQWNHEVNDVTVHMTRRQFIESYHDTPTGPSKIRELILGTRKRYKGWRIVK